MSLRVNALPQLSFDRLMSDLQRLKQRCWTEHQPLQVRGSQQLTSLASCVGPEQAAALDYVPVSIGDTWGSPHNDWRQRWFRLQLPAAAAHERGRRHLIWQAHGEHTLHWQGSAWAGLDCAHPSCLLPDQGGELLIESCLWQTAIWANPAPITPSGCRFDGATLALRDPELWQLYHDLRVPLELARHLRGDAAGGNAWEGGNHHWQPPLARVPALLRLLLDRLQRAFRALDLGDLAGAQACAQALYAELRAESWAPQATLVGHSHLDLVWCWPEGATRRKWVHTAATVAGLLDRDAEVTFINSQPWLLDRLAEDDPALHSRVSAHIASGRWQLEGMFLVESDVLLSGGETLVRCLQHGQKAFQARTGRLAQVMWIPDVFGYSGCLPQLIRLAGGQGFYTNKLTWNRVTPFPYSSFIWQGDDGSEVLAHLPPISFNGNASVEELREAVAEHRQLAVHPDILCPIGYGDGGGGLTEDHLEQARRVRDLAGLPRSRWGSVTDFFTRMQHQRHELPRFCGELYLEAHRGTPVSQVAHKQAFRRSERALQSWEAAAALSAAGPLPASAWERTIFASFHDAIPGSSIAEVYAQLNPQLDAVSEQATAAVGELLQGDADTCWFNPLSVPWQGLLPSSQGLQAVQLPALSATPLSQAAYTPAPPRWHEACLSNDQVALTFAASGQVAELSFAQQQVPLQAAPGLWWSPDHPPRHDAWETDIHDLQALQPVALGQPQILAGDRLRCELAQEFQLEGHSHGRLIWSLAAGSAGLDMRLEIDWQADHRMLRFLVPTGLRGRLARYGAPFGAAQRPQLPGYEADEARWDGAGSRWAELGDDAGGRPGLAVVSEASYGMSIRDGTLCLNLLRAPASPDPNCDRGQHCIRWQLRPAHRHSSGQTLSTAVAAEVVYTTPMAVTSERPSLAAWSDLDGLVPSWVEPLEDGCLLRAHDASGSPGQAILSLSPDLAPPQAVDFLGQALPGIDLKDLGQGRWQVRYQPWQIISLHCRRRV